MNPLPPSQIAAANAGLSNPGLTPEQIAAQNPNAQPGQIGSPDPSLTQAPQTPPPTTTPVSANSPKPPPIPTTNLQPGSQGQDVAQLQNYLVQMGYLSPDQVATGQGVYGPQTTAAVAKMQQDLGVQAGGAAGYYGPKTQSALSQKYQSIFQSVQNKTAPDQASSANAMITAASQPSTDPVFGAISSSLAPIFQAMQQVLQNINNPALTAVSLQQEYNQLAQQNNLPGMQADLLNMQRIMTGTEDDIRDEISKTGGTATESQVLGMTAARNKVILKQYNSLATQYQAAQTNVQNMMQYATTDQATQLQRQQATAGVVESMASIETQALSMGMTMQQNAKQAVQYNVTQMGYKGLAASAQGNPQMLNYYENMLGLAPGTLSDPAAVQQMDTYKDQQLQLNNYKAAIAAFNAGYTGGGSGGTGGGGTGGGTTTNAPAIGTPPIDPSTLVRPSFVGPNVPLTTTADFMDKYLKANTAAHVDPGTNNIVAPGIGYYVQQSDGSYVLNSALSSVIEKQYSDIKQTINNSRVFSGSPTVTRKWTLAANAAISSFKDSGTYKVLSNVAPYLSAINAAAKNPGDKSISDFELLDSFVKAAKGGTGQVTDPQVNVMLQGATLGDKWDVLEQKLSKGGVLSDPQRQALIRLAQGTFKENADTFKQVYVQAVQAMQGQGIPPQFWRNMPDFSTIVPAQ